VRRRTGTQPGLLCKPVRFGSSPTSHIALRPPSRAQSAMTRASSDPAHAGTAMTTPQNKYSIGQRLCEVGIGHDVPDQQNGVRDEEPQHHRRGIETARGPTASGAGPDPTPVQMQMPPVLTTLASLALFVFKQQRANDIDASQTARATDFCRAASARHKESPFLINTRSETPLRRTPPRENRETNSHGLADRSTVRVMTGNLEPIRGADRADRP